MGFTESYLYATDIEIVKNALDSDHDYMEGITFESLRKRGGQKLKLPDRWMPHAEGNFKTATGKCQFYNATIEPSLPQYIPMVYNESEKEQFPLHLLTLKTPKHFLNSSHANVISLLNKEGQPYVEINPADASTRGISDKDELKVYNQRGSVYVKARISKKVLPGVVCIPQGYWSSAFKGGSSANALTDHQLTDMGRGGALQEVKVEIEKVS